MDIRNILGKLDQLNESTMASAKKKPTGPKFVGKMKGTDPASAAKDKYVGGMEESILKELESELKKEPEKRNLVKEFAEFKEARAATAAFRSGNAKRANLNAMSDAERRAYDKEQQEKQRKRDDARLERERQKLAAKKGVVKESSDIERKIHRTQQLIQDYYNRSRATKNDIKRDHYIDMARQLEYDLQGLINDANQAEQDGYDVAQHDAEPSTTWNRGGLEEGAGKEAWAAGYAAFHDDVTKCPYAPGSEEAGQWNLGWESAQARGWDKEGMAEGDAGLSKSQETKFHKKLDTLVHNTFGKRKDEIAEGASSLNVGDPVIISGDVQYNGTTGEISEFSRDKHFVIVDLYNHGRHSFHSSDVSYNDYADSDDEEARMHDSSEFRDEIDEAFSDLDRAVMEGGHELVKETPVAPVAPVQPGKPTLGTDLTKPAGQQNAQQQQQDQKAQQLAAQKAKQEQATLTKGVNALKSAGAAVSNPNQVVKAFGKADNNQGLTPADKSSIASAGTVLAPIMANPSLQGKFKDLVTQASAEQKKEMQQQAKQPQPATTAPAVAPGPAGQVK